MENINKVFSVANSYRLSGEKYSWFAGTKVRIGKQEELQRAFPYFQEPDAEVATGCCHDMQVTFFSPVTPASAKIRSYNDRYGLVAEPVIDAAFYFDLVVKSLAAVQVMKDRNSWPPIHYIKCNDSFSSGDIERNLDLREAMEVTI